MEIKGNLKVVQEPEVITTRNGDKNKTTFVLDLTPIGAQFEQSIAIDTFNDKIAQYLKSLQIGQTIIAVCDARARQSEKNGRFYNSITAWDIKENVQ